MRVYNAYAPPNFWGDWVTIASQTGMASFTITASPVGDTLLRGRVKYYKTARDQSTDEFLDSITIHCGDSINNIEVSFMGIPMGTAVEGTVEP